jgi:hypothetical protein
MEDGILFGTFCSRRWSGPAITLAADSRIGVEGEKGGAARWTQPSGESAKLSPERKRRWLPPLCHWKLVGGSRLLTLRSQLPHAFIEKRTPIRYSALAGSWSGSP